MRIGLAGYDAHVRLALALAASCLGLACAGHEPEPRLESHEVMLGPEPPPRAPDPAPAGRRCPAGTEPRESQGEGPDAGGWACMRGEVAHGPFLRSAFDERERTWYEVRGEHVDGELHGFVHHEGFYAVEHSGRPRVFRREWFDRGRRVRSNEATVRVELLADAPVVTRRFAVKASGLAPTARWEDEPTAIGAFDLEVSAHWADAPAGAEPSVLRVELAAPGTPVPARADALLHPAADLEPPVTASDLPRGHVPTIATTWRACEPAGCELELAVALRWLAPGPGRLEVHVTARAVPDTWPASAPIEVTALEAVDDARAPGPAARPAG